MNNAHSAVYNWIFPDILKTQPSGDAVLQKAVEGIQKYLIDSKYERNLKTAVDLYLTSAEQLYGVR